MKKKTKKYKKKIEPVFTPTIEAKSSLNPLIIVVSTLIVLLIAVVILILLLLLQVRFNKIEPIPIRATNGVNFSYFVKRPDALASAKALIVYDANENVSLLSKNENVRFAPASTAKIMSALVVLDHYALDDVLEYSQILAGVDNSKMGLFLNERMSVRNLIYGMMLPSGNDAAQLLARNYPGGVEGFVLAMNKKARELGLSNTLFVDPAGYKDENYSTAYDLARLGSKALEDPFLSEVIKTRSVTVYDNSGTIPHVLENLNELLEIPGVNGIKTGFTNEAEGVLTTSFLHNAKQYVIVVLRSKDRFADTRELINGIINDLKSEQVKL